MEPDVLGHLRRLEVVIPPLLTSFRPDRSDPVHCDWRFAIDYLSIYADVPKLTLSVRIALDVPDLSQEESLWHIEGRVLRSLIALGHDASSRLQAHATLVRPLRALQEIAGFFVHIEWPWYRPSDTDDRDASRHYGESSGRRAEVADQIEEMEQWLERLVMGQDYDSYALGKNSERLRR